MDRVLVKLFVPAIESEFDIWIPLNKRMDDIISLIIDSVKELSGGIYKPLDQPRLYNKDSGLKCNINLLAIENNIKNGSEMILI